MPKLHDWVLERLADGTLQITVAIDVCQGETPCA